MHHSPAPVGNSLHSFPAFLLPLALLLLSATVPEHIPAAPSEAGDTIEGSYYSESLKQGVAFHWKFHLPETYVPDGSAALYVTNDGLNAVHAEVLEKLSKTGEVPPTVCVGIEPGYLRSTLEGGMDRWQRAEEYDQVGPEYANFLVDEFIPWLTERHGLKFSANPDMHMIGGISSSGIAAWNIAWFRNDFFHRCFMSSPTFSAFRGGEELMYLARVSETKPIRTYEIFGRDEPRLFAGDSYISALMGESGLEFAGYPYKSEYMPDGSHGCGYRDPEHIRPAMLFLWNNWKTEPVRPLRNPERVDRLVEFGTTWEETNDTFPPPVPAKGNAGVYIGEGSRIILERPNGERHEVYSGKGEITGLALSTDRWILYFSDRTRRFIYECAVAEDGSLGKPIVLAPLRLAHDVQNIGALGMCQDTRDRLYAATDLGIQGVVSFGMTDAILPLPGNRGADAVAFGGQDLSVLYAKSGDKVYKRPMKTNGKPADFPQTDPDTTNYYDGH